MNEAGPYYSPLTGEIVLLNCDLTWFGTPARDIPPMGD